MVHAEGEIGDRFDAHLSFLKGIAFMTVQLKFESDFDGKNVTRKE